MSKNMGIHARFNQAQADWLQKTCGTCSFPELATEFNLTFGTHYNTRQIRHYCINTLGFATKNIHKYTDIENAWIAANYSDSVNFNQLAETFNTVFETSVDPIQFAHHCHKFGYTYRPKKFKATKVHLAWIKENYPKYAENLNPIVSLTDAFNSRFNLALDHRQISYLCKYRLGYDSCKYPPHNYTTKQKEWIKQHDTKDITLSQLTQLFNSTFNINVSTASMKRCLSNLRYVKVKVSTGKLDSLGRPQYTVKYKHILAWETYHDQKVPKGKTVIFLNGDFNDFSKENLYCIDIHLAGVFATYEKHDIETGSTIVALMTLSKEINNKKRALQEV